MKELISEQGVERIHEAALDILETIGVSFQSERAVQLLASAGARVTGRVAAIPRHMVLDAIRSAPATIQMYDRTGAPAFVLGEDQVCFGTGSDTPFVICPDDGVRRQSRKYDTARAAVVTDALPSLDFVMSMGLAYDVPSQSSDLHQFEAMVLNTTKPILFTAHSEQGLRDIADMARWARGADDDRDPYIILYGQTTSPLQHSVEPVAKLFAAAELGIPMVYVAAVLVGGTGPVTQAGALAVAVAESLSGLVVHQLTSPGAPFIFGCGTPALDMVTGTCSYGSPELHLGNMAAKALARKYGLPVFSAAGCSDSPVFDQQAAFEAAYTIAMATLHGENLVHDVGFLGSGTVASLDLVVACDEMIRHARQTARGLVVDDATLAMDVIRDIGIGGTFLAHKHTLKNARKSLWHSRLMVRQNYERWAEAGSKTLAERSRERVLEILAQHRPTVEVGEQGRRLMSELLAMRDKG